ncbi:ankyrin repeat domain-containing protein 54-like [Toxorhynchites rutilus septentrionalis]|uniref:ankyrin repeat domain-containing protein 54-like n=1 Tax=Toxorhynchites rutilus septentrionalis TaxID=329112 RepID=UPI0024799842|nr:ankyrin repeat domain-containing protein 54-like [Toxorhynchites rutilus septentrionalis]
MAESGCGINQCKEEEPEIIPEAGPSSPRTDEYQWQEAVSVGESIAKSGRFSRRGSSYVRLLRRWKDVRNTPYTTSRPKDSQITKFLCAAMVNNTELLQEMIEKDFNPDTREATFNRSALHIACSRGFTDSVKLLLENGANPNIRDLNGNTPLHLASCTEHIAIIDLLLKYGTNVTLKDSNGLIALEIAIGKLRLSDRIISKMQKLTKSDIHTHRKNVVKVCEMIFQAFKQQVRGGSLLYIDPSEAGHMHQRHLEELLEELTEQLNKIKARNIDFDAMVDQVENLNIKGAIDSDINNLLSTLQKLSM